MILTQERLRELLHYNPDTGIFTRLVRTSQNMRVGDIAGNLDCRGYLVFCICGIKYYAHRVAWLYMTGKWPVDEIDHINGIKNENRWENLREATPTINVQNQRKAQKGNKSGFLGVSPHRKRFVAWIKSNDGQRYLGIFDTPELAHQAYLEAKRKLHPGCTI
jgi:hypothetical protein